MYRISNEDGREASSRNIGRLALFAIPLVLGIASSVWLGAWIQAHYFLVNRAQEQRRGDLVGAPKPLEESITIITPARLQGPGLLIDHAEYHGGQLTVRFHVTTDNHAFEIHWAWIAPDGSHMGQGWNKVDEDGGPWSLAAGEKAIFTDKSVGVEPRASVLEIWLR